MFESLLIPVTCRLLPKSAAFSCVRWARRLSKALRRSSSSRGILLARAWLLSDIVWLPSQSDRHRRTHPRCALDGDLKPGERSPHVRPGMRRSASAPQAALSTASRPAKPMAGRVRTSNSDRSRSNPSDAHQLDKLAGIDVYILSAIPVATLPAWLGRKSFVCRDTLRHARADPFGAICESRYRFDSRWPPGPTTFWSSGALRGGGQPG